MLFYVIHSQVELHCQQVGEQENTLFEYLANSTNISVIVEQFSFFSDREDIQYRDNNGPGFQMYLQCTVAWFLEIMPFYGA